MTFSAAHRKHEGTLSWAFNFTSECQKKAATPINVPLCCEWGDSLQKYDVTNQQPQINAFSLFFFFCLQLHVDVIHVCMDMKEMKSAG